MVELGYQIALGILLVQGVLVPVLLVGAGVAWFRQVSRLAVMEKAVTRDRRQRGTSLDALLDSLPKLQPLSCAGCGAPVALEAGDARCIGCESLAELPADYRASRALRRALARITAAAVRDWRIARALISTPARLLFRAMIVAEAALFVVVMLGAERLGGTPLDRAIARLPNEVEQGLATLGVCGFIVWTIVFLYLAFLARALKGKLAAFPDVRRGELGGVERAACHACGGGLAFRAGSFAALCPYCAVASFRPAYARRERARSEEQQVLTRASLFGALEIIEDFTGTFVAAMGMTAAGLAVLVGVAALAAYLN